MSMHLEKNIDEAIPLLKDGRIKSLGISNVSLEHIKMADESLKKNGLSLGAVQNHFSLLRNDKQKIIDFCNENKIIYYVELNSEEIKELENLAKETGIRQQGSWKPQ